MSKQLQNYSECLQEISTASDIWEARHLCSKFLRMTESAISEARSCDSPEGFLLGLIQGGNQSEEDTDRIWQQLTDRIFRDYVMAVIAPDEATGVSQEVIPRLREFANTWVFPYGAYIVCVTADPKGSVNDPEFKTLLRRYKLSAGLSRPFERIGKLRTVYEESLSTLKTIQILRHNQAMACYDDFLMIRLLDGLREDVDLSSFCLPDIQALQEYDKSHDSELCRTLLCYLEHARNATKTAADLNIHRNSVHYRINKCMELLKNLDFSNDYIAFLLMLSLYIAEYEYYRTMRKQAQALL